MKKMSLPVLKTSPILAALALAFFVNPMAAYAASVSTDAWVATADNINNGDGKVEKHQYPYDSAKIPGPANISVSSPVNSDTAAAYALADYGVLKTRATGASSGSGYSAAGAVAYVDDSLTINNDALAGQEGWMHASIDLRGNLGTSGTGFPGGYPTNASFTLYYGETLREVTYLYKDKYVYDNNPINIDGIYDLDVPIIFNEAFTLNSFLQSTAWTTGDSSAFSDLAHSVYWGGIKSVTDANGNKVAFTLDSESGHNYLKSSAPGSPSAVPVPAAVWLFGSGLAGMFGFRKRTI